MKKKGEIKAFVQSRDADEAPIHRVPPFVVLGVVFNGHRGVRRCRCRCRSSR
jgi:hypothetical protein